MWEKEGLRLTNDHYDIVSDGYLTKADGNLVFCNESIKADIPVRGIHNLNIYSEVEINTKILSWCHEYGISLTVFDSRGRYIGRFCNEHSIKRSDVFLNQCLYYKDENLRLYLAKEFVSGEVCNMRSNLRYYLKKDCMDLESSIDFLKLQLKKLEAVDDYSKLLLVEAQSKQRYYSCFNSIVGNREFEFLKRSKRPPMDRINSMISFGNCVLYTFIANDICKTAMDVKIGYLHATGRRMESLNLDIADVYKPVIVDRTIFSLIRTHEIDTAHFTYFDDGSVFLNTEGKRIFLEALYKRLERTKLEDGERINYSGIIWNDLSSLQKSFENLDRKYTAFHYSV